jgi:hypothetical protein
LWSSSGNRQWKRSPSPCGSRKRRLKPQKEECSRLFSKCRKGWKIKTEKKSGTFIKTTYDISQGINSLWPSLTIGNRTETLLVTAVDSFPFINLPFLGGDIMSCFLYYLLELLGEDSKG